MPTNLSIIPLRDTPQHLLTVAGWLFGQWGHMEAGRSLEKTAGWLREGMESTELPHTLVALDGDLPVGTASIVASDMRTHPELTPWLADVFVDPTARGQSVGSQLVGAIEAEAAKLGIGTLYLFTPDRESFYLRLSWETMERCEYRGESVIVMRRHLSASNENVSA